MITRRRNSSSVTPAILASGKGRRDGGLTLFFAP
jgi:hypothetical protein